MVAAIGHLTGALGWTAVAVIVALVLLWELGRLFGHPRNDRLGICCLRQLISLHARTLSPDLLTEPAA